MISKTPIKVTIQEAGNGFIVKQSLKEQLVFNTWAEVETCVRTIFTKPEIQTVTPPREG